MKHYICEEVGSVYRMNGSTIECATINADNTYDVDEFGPIEETMANEMAYNGMSLGDIWEKVRSVLA